MTPFDAWVNRIFLLLIVAGGIWAFLTFRSARQLAVDGINSLRQEMAKQAEEVRLSRVAVEAAAQIASAKIKVGENQKAIESARSVGTLALDDALVEYERSRLSSASKGH